MSAADTYGVCDQGHKAACHPELPTDSLQSPRAIRCPWYAWDRPESDPCQAGTPGCSVNHTAPGASTECETW